MHSLPGQTLLGDAFRWITLEQGGERLEEEGRTYKGQAPPGRQTPAGGEYLEARRRTRSEERRAGGEAGLVPAAGWLRAGAEALGRVLGRTYTEDLLDRVFSSFCVGK